MQKRGQEHPLLEYVIVAILLLAIFITILYVMQTKVLPQ